MENIYNNEKVFKYFEEISKIPRGSYNEKAISYYIVSIAKENDLKYFQDDKYNVIITKDATEGYENYSGIIIQGHMDMVCEKTKDSKHDFKKDGIELIVDGDFLHANNTTLGADNGIAVAMGLSLITDDSIKHPKLELVFTTSEEEGLDGVNNIKPGVLTGKYMINLDTEEEGVLISGCAGGKTVYLKNSNNKETIKKNSYEIHIHGLRGGHSGMEIDNNYLNAIKISGELLKEISEKYDIRVVSIKSGNKHNAIPREAQIILSSDEEIDYNFIKKEFEILSNSENNSTIDIEKIDNFEYCMDLESTENIITLIREIPHGVFNYMDGEYSDIVETSCNFAILESDYNNNEVVISIRSSKLEKRDMVYDKIYNIAYKFDLEISDDGGYKPWEFKEDSKLREIAVKLYKNMYGKDMEISVIHAGLECAVFEELYPELDIISTGPNIYNVHTPKEKLSIKSTQKTYDFIVELLQTIK